MPKQKTKKSAAKRFVLTGSGKDSCAQPELLPKLTQEKSVSRCCPTVDVRYRICQER